MTETLFISDLHLDRDRPRIIRLFDHFLKTRAARADALYILGDLFEHWIGDDDTDHGLESVLNGLQQLTVQGVPVYFIHGNRDFLIGKSFAAHTGCTLLPEACVVDLYGHRTLIMHGDTLCTDDVAYQKFRRKTHNKILQYLILSINLKRRRALATWLRHKSQTEIGKKSAEIMDVNQHEVEDAMMRHSTNRLIHGHTHRPAIHEFELEGVSATRIVLGDWYEQGSLVSCTQEGHKLESLKCPESRSTTYASLEKYSNSNSSRLQG